MNIVKRSIAFALASVFTFGTVAFADSVNITQRDSYIDKEGNGNLRFISEAKLDGTNKVEKFGTWIVPKYYLDDDYSVEKGDHTVTFETTEGVDDANTKKSAKFTADIMGIPQKLIGAEFYAKSFIIYASEVGQEIINAVVSSLASSSATVRTSEVEEENYTPTYYTPEPTAEPTPTPTAESTPTPTAEPTPTPTAEPTPTPTAEPTPTPTAEPTPTPTPVPTSSFETKFVNRDKYLYRVGNNGAVSLGTLFKAKEGVTIDSSAVKVRIDTIDNTAASGTCTENTSDWTQRKITFSDTGVVKVTINDGTVAEELLLEVVDAVNATGATSATANNVVLLNDVGFSSISVKNGYTLYGNGFKMTCSSDSPALNRNYGFVDLENGILDNVQIICPDFPYAILYDSNKSGSTTKIDGDKTKYYNICSAVFMQGSSKIVDSYISGGRAAVYVGGKDQEIINSTINGGAAANIHLGGADTLLLENVTTIQVPTKATVNDTSKTLMGLGVACVEGSTAVTIEGSLRQYNWFSSDDLQYIKNSQVKTILQQALGMQAYQHTVNGKTCINSGFAFIEGDSTITDNRTDRTAIPYGWVQGLAYTYQNSNGTSEEIATLPVYEPTQNGVIAPKLVYSGNGGTYTAAYDVGTESWNGTYSFELERGATHTVDLSKIKAVSFGKTLAPTSIKLGDVSKTGTVTYGDSAVDTYTVTFSDDVSYNANGEAVSVTQKSYTYTFTVKSTMIDRDPPAKISDPTGSSIKVSQSASGDWSVAFPVIEGMKVKYWSTAANEYKEITLSDILTSTTYGTISGANFQNGYTLNGGDFTLTVKNKSPFKSSDYGVLIWVNDSRSKLYATTDSEFAANSTGNQTLAKNITVNYVFTDNNGKTLSFDHTFNFTNSSSHTVYNVTKLKEGTISTEFSSGGGGGICFAEGTLVNLADGTKKPIEAVTHDDELLTRDFFTGEYKKVKPAVLIHHDHDYYDVITLNFNDGTDTKIIGEHGFYDVEENKFVYLTSANIADYIGHRFIKTNGIESREVILSSYCIKNEYTASYSIITPFYINFVAEDLLNISPPQILNMFQYGDGLKYDEAAMKADIERYGLYTYDDFKDYLTYEQFEALNFKYFKLHVGRGTYTYNDIIEHIKTYLYDPSALPAPSVGDKIIGK